MDDDQLNDPLRRLQILQRDLVTFTESRLVNLARLEAQLNACQNDLQKLLERNKKNEASRAKLAPNNGQQASTIEIDGVRYQIEDQFRQSVLQVADELDLDEIEAADLCIRSQAVGGVELSIKTLFMRAVLRFHEQRQTVLGCLRVMLQASVDNDDENSDGMRSAVNVVVQGENGGQEQASAFWRKCVEGLGDIEMYLRKVSDYRDKLLVTGQGMGGEDGDFLIAQRMFLTRQHEAAASILTYLIRGNHTQPQDFRGLLSKVAVLETDFDISIHYLPIFVSGASQFSSDHITSPEAALDLHRIFAAGPGQVQWKQPNLKAAATVCWLAEYSSRFSPDSADAGQSESERAREEDARSKLFFDALKDRAFHLMLAATACLKPVIWHDPARSAIVEFLLEHAAVMPADAPPPSEDFSSLTMQELQAFTDAFVSYMPDTLRKLKTEEDDSRRNILSQPTAVSPETQFDLERFMVIMAIAHQDDPESARSFWGDRESNLFGFLRWASQRLPTPRVAAFCQLLRGIASDDASANSAHRFLLEDPTMTSGKLRKGYSVSWAQIFSELELYAQTIRNRPSAPESAPGQDRSEGVFLFNEPETDIMMDAYLGLAAHICRRSPEARNWLLREQPFHIGEVMIQLARSGTNNRIKACCLDMLASMLTDQALEVRNGIWVLLDQWVSSGGSPPSPSSRAPGRVQYSARDYLRSYANSPEAALSLVSLLNALVAPAGSSDALLDALPFPEHLGVSHRHAGIDSYVDFVMEGVFAYKIPDMLQSGDGGLINLLRYECLNFALQCLSSFNEDLVLLANTTDVSVEAAMETKSLATYARLHPFARVMEWLFDRRIIVSLFATLGQNIDALNDADPRSPLAQATLKSIQVLTLAWKLQPTYVDIVRPAILAKNPRAQPVQSIFDSIDDIFLSHLQAVVEIALFTASDNIEISLASLTLLQRIGASRKMSESAEADHRGRYGSRMISVLAPLSSSLTIQLSQEFTVESWDLETIDAPPKVIKAKAILDLLNASLDALSGKPTIAHLLLGFHCRERAVEVLPQTPFADGKSLFHAIASSAGISPVINNHTHTSWLYMLKRGCLEIVLKLARSHLTAAVLQPQLRTMEFVAALSQAQVGIKEIPTWDGRTSNDYETLISSSASAMRDFMRVREGYFEVVATDLRAAAERGAFSVQERLVGTALGMIKMPTGEQVPTMSVFELLDFFDLETPGALIVPKTTYFDDAELSNCIKDDPETLTSFDVHIARELLVLRKRELKDKGVIKEPADVETADNEIGAILAALTSQNSFAAIQSARLDALEAWTDLLSLVVTKGGLEQNKVVPLALQGLLIVLPKFEKSLSENLEATALLAKLTLTFTHAISAASSEGAGQTADVAIERLLGTFRASIKVVTDSSTDLALRDVSYRTSCAVIASIPKAPTNGRSTPASSSRQLLQLVQSAGDRLFSTITEDAFSGRGVTRVSALLFLDSLVTLHQNTKSTASVLRALTKLNFVPVLIDMSIGNVAAAFKGEDEMIASLAYVHTALALLLRLCQTPEGTLLVLNSGLYAAIDDSKLFSTDPDLGLDIDNPAALKEFHAILADVLRLITATVVQKGAAPGRTFLHQNRFTVQAIFKQAARGLAGNVAEELGRLVLATDFLEEDEAVHSGGMANGFT